RPAANSRPDDAHAAPPHETPNPPRQPFQPAQAGPPSSRAPPSPQSNAPAVPCDALPNHTAGQTAAPRVPRPPVAGSPTNQTPHGPIPHDHETGSRHPGNPSRTRSPVYGTRPPALQSAQSGLGSSPPPGPPLRAPLPD